MGNNDENRKLPRPGVAIYKFQKLEVYGLALEYLDLIYEVAAKLPRSEDFNLKSQITRAGTSIVLNIAEGSTSQSDAEQTRFLGIALRSLIETVACQDVIWRRGYADNEMFGNVTWHSAESCLQNFKHSDDRFDPDLQLNGHRPEEWSTDSVGLLSSVGGRNSQSPTIHKVTGLPSLAEEVNHRSPVLRLRSVIKHPCRLSTT